jgi:hypothetical protein
LSVAANRKAVFRERAVLVTVALTVSVKMPEGILVEVTLELIDIDFFGLGVVLCLEGGAHFIKTVHDQAGTNEGIIHLVLVVQRQWGPHEGRPGLPRGKLQSHTAHVGQELVVGRLANIGGQGPPELAVDCAYVVDGHRERLLKQAFEELVADLVVKWDGVVE